ncbi:MAG: hypothetical protein ACKV22_24695 [Bryobacteraceae bacterium]
MDGSQRVKGAILMGVAAAMLIAIGHLYWTLERTREDMMALRLSVLSELAKIRLLAQAPEKHTLAASEVRRLEDLKKDVETQVAEAKGIAVAAARNAKVEAVTHADQLVRKLGAEQRNQHQQVASQLGEVRQAASDKFNSVSTELTQVKTQVASTHEELERTVIDLKTVRGDMGVQSGLIATNAKELSALRKLGERNYFDFHLERSKDPRRVGDISVILKRTDAKKNRFTLEIIVGDIKTEKKDRSINEPVQFYVDKSSIPYELVVNEVQKNYVIGYLAAPKVTAGRKM